MYCLPNSLSCYLIGCFEGDWMDMFLMLPGQDFHETPEMHRHEKLHNYRGLNHWSIGKSWNSELKRPQNSIILFCFDSTIWSCREVNCSDQMYTNVKVKAIKYWFIFYILHLEQVNIFHSFLIFEANTSLNILNKKKKVNWYTQSWINIQLELELIYNILKCWK